MLWNSKTVPWVTPWMWDHCFQGKLSCWLIIFLLFVSSWFLNVSSKVKGESRKGNRMGDGAHTTVETPFQPVPCNVLRDVEKGNPARIRINSEFWNSKAPESSFAWRNKSGELICPAQSHGAFRWGTKPELPPSNHLCVSCLLPYNTVLLLV